MLSGDNGESGFTIIEVMIAVLVLVVGLVGAAAMQTRAVDEANSANRMSQRVTAAEQQIEDLMSRPIMAEGDLIPDSLFDDPLLNDGTWYAAPDPYTAQPRQVIYRARAGYPLENLTTIEVSVIPSGMSESQREKKRINLPYIRSVRWN